MIDGIKKHWRLAIELFLTLGLILSLIAFGMFAYKQKNLVSTLKSDDANSQKTKIEQVKIGMERRQSDSEKFKIRNSEYSTTKELLSQSFSSTYEVTLDNGLEGMDAMFAPTETKQFQKQKYTCLNSDELASNQQINQKRDSLGLSGQIILWCATDSKILTTILIDDAVPTIILIANEQTPRIIQQREIISRGNSNGDVKLSLVEWKNAPEIDESFISFQFSEFSKSGNLMWEPNTREYYLYHWITPGNLQLREYCDVEEFDKDTYPDKKPTTTCSHVERTSQSKYQISLK